ncbi:lantibiotic immunity ABC transporter MutE/EpiE family permease subunit [Staphylococcus americanisciuri]|uniref:lantibiotic immunity ABC transporter MutE/EpiE family permease subunit n=1 Tax=Staphylococcus americanisciuri TaxID=2973940 RepID=UPI0035713850
MFNYIFVEHLKGKRTFSHKFIIIYPLLISLLCIPFTKLMYSDINYFVPLIYNWWPTLFLPIGLSVLVYQSLDKEVKASSDKYFFLLDTRLIWLSKILLISVYSLIGNLNIAIFSIIIQFVLYGANVQILNILFASLVLWITTLFIIPLSMMIGRLFRPLSIIIFNVIGMCVSMFTVSNSYWYFIPWSWSLRIITPIVKTRPNGTLLPENDVLNDTTIILPGCFLAIFAFSILTIAAIMLLKGKRGDQS